MTKTNKINIKSLFKKEGDIVFITPQYNEVMRAIRPSLWGMAEDVTITCDFSRTSTMFLAELSANLIELEREGQDRYQKRGKLTIKFPNGKTVILS